MKAPGVRKKKNGKDTRCEKWDRAPEGGNEKHHV